MAALLITILFITFSVLLFKDNKRWIPLTLSVIYFILPKEACMILGLKPNIMILVIIIGVIIYYGRLNKVYCDLLFKPIILFYFLYTAFLSLFTTSDVSYFSQMSFLIKKTIEMFFLGILSIAFFVHTNDFKKFTRTFYIIVLIGSIYGLFSYLTLSNPYMSFVSSSFRDGIGNGADFFLNESRGVLRGRISGFANHPLTWGQLHLLFVIVLPFFKKYLSNKLFWGTMIMSSLNILMTGSRSSLVPLILFFVGYLLIENRKHITKIITIGLIGFALFMILGSLLNSEYIDTIRAYVCFWDESASEKISVSGSSVSMREEQFDNAFYFIGEKKLLVGFGYGFVSNMSEDHFLREYLLGFESVALKVIVEQGILGLVFYVLMFAFLCMSLMKYRNNAQDNLYIVLMFICYFSSLLFTGERCTFQLFFFFLILIVQEKKVLGRDIILLLKYKGHQEQEQIA